MTPTKEQQEIIAFDLKLGQSLCVEAGAGTGKTTCFIEYSKARPNSKILYLCFNNKSAKEAQEKYKAQNITNTHTSTIHGLASKIRSKYELAGKFNTKLSIKDIEKRFGYSPKLSWLILETIKNYCYSKDNEIEATHLPQTVEKENKTSNILIKESQRVWTSMVSLKDPTPMSYDQYLKIFQLSKPKLNYDYILLDEAQDSNPLTLAILGAQKENTRTILIGDENQAIYGWRGAKNAMRQWNSDAKLKLSESFRFGKSIAQIANTILKSYPEGNPRITGTRDQDYLNYPPKNTPQNTTYIARTNSTLFEKAIELQTRGIKCHFVNTEESEGWDPTIPYKLADLKDVYRLWSGNPKGIENPVIKLFKNYHELRKLALGGTQNNKNPKTTGGDKELEYLCRMVEKYKHQLPTLVQLIKDQACGPPQDPQDKVAILCTAHRSKGLEWENVEIANDFLEIQEIEKNLPEYKELTKDDQEYQSFIEEINLLYVACTRAKSNLYLNKDLLKVCIKHQIPLSQPKEMIEEDEVLHKAIAQETDPAIPAIPTIPAIPAIPTIPNSIHKINKDTNNPHHNNSHHSTTLYLTL